MAKQLLQDGTVFEITDHTTATDWERFIAQLEEVLSVWGVNKQSEQDLVWKELPEGYISSGLWHEKHDIIRFGNVSFDMRYQYLVNQNIRKPSKESSAKQEDEESTEKPVIIDEIKATDAKDGNNVHRDVLKEKDREHGEYELPENLPLCLHDLIATSNDFASKAHCLVRWYNLRGFIILSPRGDTIVSDDRLKLVLSSASVAIANVDCHVPVFVRIHNPKSNFYQGISEHFNIRTTYEMIFYKQSLNQYTYLSELISIFREKIGGNLSDPISATIRLNYCLDYFDLFLETKDQFEGNEYSDDDQDELYKMTAKRRPSKPIAQDMRTYATFDQVKDALNDCLPHPFKILRFLHVAALWPPISDKVITDSRVHSDLDPAEAPIWTMRCVTSDNCNLKIVHDTQALHELFKAAINYAYDKLDGSQVFSDCDKETMISDCLEICYQLATKSEVILSKNPSDHIRKLMALLFYRATELRVDLDALDQIAGQLKKRPSLNEVYRDFKRHKPSIKEFIIRTQLSRPFNPRSTPALPQRMFCSIGDDEFRLCGAFSELCN